MTWTDAWGLHVCRREVGGAVLLTIADHRLPIVHFAVALRHGAAPDPPGGAGTTRLLLDMLLRGTRRHGREAFASTLEGYGSSIDVVVGSEVALLQGICLSRHLAATLSLLGEALTEPAFDGDEHRKLVEEACDGLRAARDDDDDVAALFWRRSYYGGDPTSAAEPGAHPFCRSPLGELADLRTLGSDALRVAHEQRIRPCELVFAFAGDMVTDEVDRLLCPVLARLPQGAVSVPPPPPPPEPKAPRIVVVDKPERTQTQLRVGRPTLSGGAPDALAFWLGATAFGGTFTSPFCNAVRDERGWSYVAYASFDRRARTVAPLLLVSAPAIADAVPCLALEIELYRELADGRFADGAVELAQEYLLNRQPLALANAHASLIPALRNELLGLEPEEIFRCGDKLAAVDRAAVQRVVRQHLHPTRVLVVMVATAAAVVPALTSRFPDVETQVVDFRAGLGLKHEPS